MYTIKNTTGGCGAKGAGIAPPGNPGDILYLVSSGVAGAATDVLYTGSGNLYAANSVTTTNVFATRYYGDGGLLSNISSGGFTQPLANLVVSNSVTTTNIFATTANIATMNVGYLTVNSAVVYGTSTLNVYGTSNLTNVTVRDTFNVNGSMSANAANATFFFDTFTIPYINTQVINVASNIILSGNLSAPLANITTLNVNYLTVNSAVVYGTSTLNVYGVSNLSTATMVGTFGKTTLNVTGNVYASNAVTTTNVFAVTANVGTLNVWQVSNLVSLSLSNNLYAANAVTTTNVFTANVTATGVQTIAGLTGLTSLNVTGNVYVSNAVTATSHYGNVSASNVVVTPATGVTGISVTGNLYASNAVTATTHFGNVSASNVVVTPATGVTGINVTGNLYASNAVTTTNVFTTNVTATNVTGTSLIGTHYGVLAGSNTVSASSATFTTAFGQGTSSTLTLVDGTRSLNFDVNAGVGNYNGITAAGDQLIWGSAGSINTGTLTIAPHNTGTVGVRIGSTSNIVTIASNVTTFQSNGAAAVMTLTNGRLGVGTASPQSPLHVYKNGNYPEVFVDYGAGGQVASLSTGTAGTLLGYSGYLAVGTITGAQAAGFSEKVRITSGGNVGIGTATPSSSLHFGTPVVNKIIALYDSVNSAASTATDFYGFGINAGTLRYNTDSTGSVHKFYGGSTLYATIASASSFSGTVQSVNPAWNVSKDGQANQTGVITYSKTDYSRNVTIVLGSGTVQVPVAGFYQVNFHSFIDSGVAGNGAIYFRLNGSKVAARVYSSEATAYRPMTINAVISVAANDIFSVVADAITLHGNDSCNFSGHLIA